MQFLSYKNPVPILEVKLLLCVDVITEQLFRHNDDTRFIYSQFYLRIA